MSKKKKPYEATSPIKHNGTHYGIGDTLNLTEEQADGLHVKPGKPTADSAAAGETPDYTNGSDSLNAKVAIKWIENASEDALEGFVDPEKEDRATVLGAWDDRFDTNLAEDDQ